MLLLQPLDWQHCRLTAESFDTDCRRTQLVSRVMALYHSVQLLELGVQIELKCGPAGSVVTTALDAE